MAHANTRNTIALRGNIAKDELVAAGAITPGHLVKRSSATQCVVHATEGGYAEALFAAEDALQGNTVDTAYASTNVVQLLRPSKGQRVNAIIAAGQNVAAGDLLISAGDGTLKRLAGASSGVTVRQAIAVAAEALNLSGGGATAGRCAVDII